MALSLYVTGDELRKAFEEMRKPKAPWRFIHPDELTPIPMAAKKRKKGK